MIFQVIPPPPILRNIVKSFWYFEGESGNDIPYLYHAMADALPELVFQYKGCFERLSFEAADKLPRSYVFGQSSLFTQKTCNGGFGAVGVYLYPFAIPLLFAIPASELSNQIVDLNTLLPQQNKELEERIMLAASNTERVNIIAQFLYSCLHKNCLHDDNTRAAIRYIIQQQGKTDIDSLASRFFTSTRQFERNFKKHSGFSPKLFSRIIRFQSALNEFGNTAKTLTEIAYECNYYDQSHFIHDFREFSGVHPKLYFKGNAPGTELRSQV